MTSMLVNSAGPHRCTLLMASSKLALVHGFCRRNVRYLGQKRRLDEFGPGLKDFIAASRTVKKDVDQVDTKGIEAPPYIQAQDTAGKGRKGTIGGLHISN